MSLAAAGSDSLLPAPRPSLADRPWPACLPHPLLLQLSAPDSPGAYARSQATTAATAQSKQESAREFPAANPLFKGGGIMDSEDDVRRGPGGSCCWVGRVGLLSLKSGSQAWDGPRQRSRPTRGRVATRGPSGRPGEQPTAVEPCCWSAVIDSCMSSSSCSGH